MPNLFELAKGAVGIAPRAVPIAKALGALLLSKPTTERSLPWFVERAARQWPHRDAVRTPEGSISFRELNLEANRMAGVLQKRGVRPGSAVTVMLENRIELLVAFVAVMKTGAAAVMINTNQQREALAHSLSVCAPAAMIVGAECVAQFLSVPGDSVVASSVPRFWLADGEAKALTLPDGFEDLGALATKESPVNPWLTPAPKLGDPAYYIFTSGTTGLPKASVMSHLRWVKATHIFGGACLDLGPDDAVYAPLPLYHNNALTIGFGACLVFGAAFVTRRRFSASTFWSDCRRYGATSFLYIGELPQYLLAQPPSEDDGAHPTRKALGNGLRPEIWKEFRRRFHVEQVFEIYAASEMNISFLNILNLDETVGLCPAAWALVAHDPVTGDPLRDGKGHLIKVKKGQPGLLVAEVTERFSYDGYTDAEASERRLVRNAWKQGDVWFCSGDLLRDVGYGHLQFVDRIGDTFRWKGENVSTLEVERILGNVPGVRECTVYGVEVSGHSGRAGMAAVVCGEGFDVGRAAVALTANLPRYAVPLFLREVPSLQITGTFKHRKVVLRDEGFNPGVIVDPIWVLTEGGVYERLTVARYDGIERGDVRL